MQTRLLSVLVGSMLTGLILTAPATAGQAPEFLGLVDEAGLKALENQPTHLVLKDKGKEIDGKISTITTLQRGFPALRLIEVAEGRRKRRIKPDEVKTMFVNRVEHTLFVHVPSQSFFLVDKKKWMVVAKQLLDSRKSRLTLTAPDRQYGQSTSESLKFAQDAATTLGEGVLAKELKEVILLTDMPEPQVAQFDAAITRLIAQMNEMFGVASFDLLGSGKPVLAVFVDRMRLNGFETDVLGGDPIINQHGILHKHRERTIVAIEDGRSGQHVIWQVAWGLASQYVRFSNSDLPVPPWLEVGMQHRTADNILPRISSVRMDMQQAKVLLFQAGSLNGLFSADNIPAESEVLCKLMIGYLQGLSDVGFQQLFQQVKLGMSFPDALQSTYGMTEEQFAAGFGQTLGLPRLAP